MAAFTVDVLVYPLDTIKTRYQSQQYTPRSVSTIGTPTGLFRGLYQGIGSVVIATLPAGECSPASFVDLAGRPFSYFVAGVFFITYEAAKSGLTNWLPSIVPLPAVHAVASGAAELASCLVLTPAEVVKQNAQVIRESGSHGRSTSAVAFRLLRQGGNGLARTLWSGYTALAARNLPFTALQFPLFEFLRGQLSKQRHGRKTERVAYTQITHWSTSRDRLHTNGPEPALLTEIGVVTSTAAAISGATAALITTPTDVIKTRMMLAAGARGRQDDDKKTSQEKRNATRSFQVAKSIFREEGFRGLFRGAALRMVWAALGSGLYLGSYEMAKVWLKRDSFEPGNAIDAAG